MTVLYSLYTSEGLVWAADRMLTTSDPGQPTQFHNSEHPKVFRAPGVGVHNQGALVGYFGQAYVGAQPMGLWLPQVCQTYQGSPIVLDFAQHLRDRFMADSAPAQRVRVLGFHLGAFEMRNGARVPVFYFVRNAEVQPLSGGYGPIHADWQFEIDEQFLALVKPIPHEQLRTEIRKGIKSSYGIPAWFRNGDVAGFANVTESLEKGIRGLLMQNRSYQVPRSLARWRSLAALYIRAATMTAEIYYRRGTPTMGGRADVIALPWDDVAAG